MYAIICSGGKQYKVESGQTLRLEKLPGKVGEQIKITPLLIIKNEKELKIGHPFLEGYVTAVIQEQDKNRKVIVFKKKRRKGYKVKRGHRQYFTTVRIETINI